MSLLNSPAQSRNGFMTTVESFRLQASHTLESETRSRLGQYFTSLDIAEFMASMTPSIGPSVNILDPGAGVGILSAAVISKLLKTDTPPDGISVTAYEIDRTLHPYLEATLKLCKKTCKDAGITFDYSILGKNFIEDGVRLAISKTQMKLFESNGAPLEFDLVISNPPYKKISGQSETRKALRRVGIETSNLYSAFIAVALMLTAPEGHLIAITPRSFCNGAYFKAFRQFLFTHASFKQIHIFQSRNAAFAESDVLQENIIFHLVKNTNHNNPVLITSGESPADAMITNIEVPHNIVISNTDPNKFIHIIRDEPDRKIIEKLDNLPSTLADLKIKVSTGRVVDFRAAEFIRKTPTKNTVPLIYPTNIHNGSVRWPKPASKKPQAIVQCQKTQELLVDNGVYVLTRRFTSKEQPRRIVAALHTPDYSANKQVGFENHINYFHANGKPLEKKFALGLVAFLNSTLVDIYFRTFNGHTQINATDLRAIKYPDANELRALGEQIGDRWPGQDRIDQLIERSLLTMSEKENPVSAIKKVKEAISILKALGLPKAQQNERSGLTLLALLDLKPNAPWNSAKAPLIGITEMMDFFDAHYGKKYAPNSRETVRRFTVHQFVQAGIVVANPDKPRPVNSPNYVYQIELNALKLVREFGTKQWSTSLSKYLASLETLRDRYAQVREMRRIPINFPDDAKITLSPGGQNVLVKEILEEFCPRFTPDATLIYLGDTADKWAYFDERAFEKLGIAIPDEHGKIPDVIVHYSAKNWLVLIEAVSSHGPINPKRKIELEQLFADSNAGLVFVTAFLTRKTLLKYLGDIAWETEVWVAESPSHMIHFNGGRFLGPYQ